MPNTAEVDWARLDKRKFILLGGGLFSGLTLCLYPLSAVKTRQMALEGSPRGIKGAMWTARTVVAAEGIRGLYAGLGTVLCGMIPARLVYMMSLEMSKSTVRKMLQPWDLPGASLAGAANLVGGAMASLSSHAITVPLDVVAQRQMIRTGQQQELALEGARSRAPALIKPGGVAMARHILETEGFRGMYRGLGASIATYVPASGIWWASYGVWQTVLWECIDRGAVSRVERTDSRAAAVQAVSGVLTGCTSAVITNPLDVVKTRIQTRRAEPGVKALGWTATARKLAEREGWRGFYRGLAPRMVTTSMWGTAMVSTYEFLKRVCAIPEEQ